MRSEDELGVLIESGLSDWQILQQDGSGCAALKLSGRWVYREAFARAAVYVRLVDEASGQAVSLAHDWTRALTRKDGTWTVRLKDIPAGGLYRLETCLNLDGGPIEWSLRGDMRHHTGVGDIWILAGQSNSEGHGRSPIDDPPELGVHVFRANGSWALASHPLNDATDTRYPANRIYCNPSHCPWLHFAKLLSKELGYPIGLVPAALGGSPLEAWHRKSGGYLFDNMLDYVRDAGGARGMAWYQGESDTGPEQCQTYIRRFREFVADLRKSLKSEDLPVVTVQLNRSIGQDLDSTEAHRGWEAIREAQRQIARTDPNVFAVASFGALLADGIHNDSSGNMLFGRRLVPERSGRDAIAPGSGAGGGCGGRRCADRLPAHQCPLRYLGVPADAGLCAAH
ncbi:MAG: sialate O-acetylesterase [Candidatus Latescibacteria bacterium]|jgi:hypothetical protein|nr:sialate O-acetylesterase [Candidatus Latescibacterota bacterium]